MLKVIFKSVFIMLLASCSIAEKADKAPMLSIHINQVAFEQIAPKSAVITSNKGIDLSQVSYGIYPVKDGEVKQNRVFKGKLKPLAPFHQWQAANKNQQPQNYYHADFSTFTQNGDFRLVFTYGNENNMSSDFTIGKQVVFRETVAAMLQYFNGSRNDNAHNWDQDKRIRIFDTQRYVDVRGGWNDAGGDTGKYLSHLSYANYFNPQQLAHVAWALAYSYQAVPHLYDELDLTEQVTREVFWGADYLHRILDPQGYFYMTVFDQWNTNNAERVVTAYVGADGVYSEDYQSAFRQGAGSAIAALAKAAVLAQNTGQQGEFTGQQYLADAEKAFHHLQDNGAENNKRYADDGQENIIDDYTALLAATELFKATKDDYYLKSARERANNLARRMTNDGWFISNAIDSDNLRPFYHAAEAGFPIVSLSQFLTIETEDDIRTQTIQVINKYLVYQLALNNKVSNPFNYARQPFKTYSNGKLSTELQEGFFIPHANETGYWWQGESARLSSLAMAAILGGRAIRNSDEEQVSNFGVKQPLAQFAQNQLDWTLGRNPYDLSMLNGFGDKNPIPYDGLSMVYGGISNGITGAKGNDSGRGIEFGPESDWQNWRWVEQWLPHSTWFLLATTEMAKTQ
jgi:hypothetical protein